METFNITSLFFRQTKLHPKRVAIIEDNKEISFEKLAEEVDETVQYFLYKGIRKNDRVMVFVPMSIDLYRIVLALFKIGAVAVFLDEWINKKRLEVCCDIADCSAIIGGWKVSILRIISKPVRKIPIQLSIQYRSQNTEKSIDDTILSDAALITFTTGSTGTPKAAKRTHGFLLEQFKALEIELESTAGTISMTALPIVLFLQLGLGCTSVIANFNPKKQAKLNVKNITSLLHKYQIQNIIASPYFIQTVAAYAIRHKLSFPALQKIFTGGAPVFPREARLYLNAFPNASTKIVYGSTEAEPISSIHAETLLHFTKESFECGLNVGIPAVVTTVKIIPSKDEPIILPDMAALDRLALKDSSIGEIIVAGKHVLDAYFNNTEALMRNKIFIQDQVWHRTGDSGFINNNYLYLTGRCSTLIHHNHSIIAPFIIENQLQEISGIQIGTILQHKNSIYILLELVKGANKEEIINAISSLFAPFDKIIFFKKLPRDPRHHSKIDYEACKLLLT